MNTHTDDQNMVLFILNHRVIIELLIAIQFHQFPDTKRETELLLSPSPNLDIYSSHSRQLLNHVTIMAVVAAIAIVRYSNGLK